MTVFRWVPDPEVDVCPPCPHCGAETEALMVEPDRSPTYLREVFMCVRVGCRRVWPRLGARALKGVNA
jgi:hypothetical protein